MNPFGGSAKRNPSGRTVKRSVQRPFGRLALDTSFARHQGQPPQQIAHPYETKTQELTFIAFDDAKAHLQSGIEDNSETHEPLHPGPKRSAQLVQNPPDAGLGINRPRQVRSYAAALCESTPMLDQEPLHHTQHSYSKRIRKLRPSPLDLGKDDRSSSRMTPAGIAVVSRFSADTKSPTTAGTHYRTDNYRYGRGGLTPSIVVTPAVEDFEEGYFEEYSGGLVNRRPSSSVYSRYTNFMPRSAASNEAPPVPPLPSFISPTTSSPRRSKGWWNLITSPFSARSGISFWRSPSIREEGPEEVPILRDVSAMGMTNPHAGVIFTNRSEDDDELRSAPAMVTENMALPNGISSQTRSFSAPGVLGPNVSDFNIYDIPEHGEAASYFNPHKHFPSLVFSPAVFTESPRDILDGWSPSQSVAHPDREVSIAADEVISGQVEQDIGTRNLDVMKRSSGSSTVPNPLESEDVLAPPGPIETDRGVFSSPAEHELRTARIPQSQPSRSLTHITSDTIMSPLSATPVVANARVATPFGPQSSFGEQREVEVIPTRTSNSLSSGPALGLHTMSHAAGAQDPPQTVTEHPPAEKSRTLPYQHVRQDSYGLGISGTDSDRATPDPTLVAPRTPPELPPPPTLSEKPLLTVDKFGQLQVRSLEEGASKPVVPWYRRFMWVLIAGAATLMMLLIILLVLFVPQSHEDMPVQAQWLRLSGFPAMPTGVSTVIQPHSTTSQTQCVAPSSLWSCAAPVEQGLNQPNFRFEIRFRNGTLPHNETLPIASQNVLSKRFRPNRLLHTRRSTWLDYLFTANPSPPSQDDQVFLGRTTDNASTPYNGEQTPFWISLLNPKALESATSSIHKRDDSNFTYPYPDAGGQSSSKNASTNAANDVPKPNVNTNGEPLPQLLYPLASAQPLRLYNRGQDTEHYGFYTYFDRTIYVSIDQSSNGNRTNTTISNVPLANATAVCAWSQTRLLVQMWTRRANISTTSLSSNGSAAQIPAGNSSANDMQSPGSFPYPVTVTVDRHGGNAAEKGVYCYGIDATAHTVLESVSTWIAEDRGIGGTLVHPAAVPGSNGTTSGLERRDDSNATTAAAGGIDGGSGGCLCQWQNW